MPTSLNTNAKEGVCCPLVSVVILSWNRCNDLLDSLQHLSNCNYLNLETIVIDNGSTDGTQKNIQEQFPEVELICLPNNIGVSAYNIGFKKALGEYILILDDDSYPAPESIDRMVELFETDPEIGIIAFDVHQPGFHQSLVNGVRVNDKNDLKPATYLMGFNGAGAGVRRTVFDDSGYYPDEFFLYMNETDLSLRVLNAGYRIVSSASIIAYHKNSPKNRRSWRAPFFYTRNTFWLIWKNYPWCYLVPYTIRLTCMVIFYSLEQRTSIYLQAMWNAVANMQKVIPLRKPVKQCIAGSVRLPLEIPFTFYR